MKRTQGEKSERSRSLILEAALDLFSMHGYRATSIREIADAAGLSTGNVYHHFPDKEAVFNTLLNQYWAAIDNPEFPFNKALMAGAFPHDLEALARAAEESVRLYRRQVALIYVDVVEFKGIHIHKYYTEMAGRFAAFLNHRYPGDALKDQLAVGVEPNTALMLASRVFIQYYALEIVFDIPQQFGLSTPLAIREVSEILRHGILRTAKAMEESARS